MNLFKQIQEKIDKSLVDHLGKVSSATISSYFILVQIMLMGSVYLVIDIVNATIMWRKDQLYTIPSESIFILGLVLSHHLVLLGIKKSGDAAMYPTVFKTSTETTTKDGVTEKRKVQVGDTGRDDEDAAPVEVPVIGTEVNVNVGGDDSSTPSDSSEEMENENETTACENCPKNKPTRGGR